MDGHDVPELLRLRSSNPSSAPLSLHIRWSSLPSLWAAQANYILDSLQTSTTPDNIALCNAIWFNLFVTDPPPTTPDGYLFLCPKDHFIVNHGSFRWPERATFWSLDPSGSPPMSDSEAQELGFPKLSKRIEVNARYWYRDPKVYDRLRRFHEAKGFNDSGHDVARHLGYPLLQLQREKGRGVHHDSDDSSTDVLSRESGNGKAAILETQETQGHIDSSPGRPDQVNGNDYTRVAAELSMDMVSSSFGRNSCDSEMVETNITEPSVSDSPRFSRAFKSTPNGQDDSPSLDRDIRAISPWDYTDDSLVYPRNNFVFLARFVLIVSLSLVLLLDKLQQVVPRQI
ncbi:hypothetical protein C8J57DRAFT_173177 [Mycena rebaudengoi]|nr:hypothetical protein C8J57DRAFT_173177 [Mycena rebaudengoi]